MGISANTQRSDAISSNGPSVNVNVVNEPTVDIGDPGPLALDATVVSLLNQLVARLGVLGQAAMAASTPVVIANDQSAIPVSGAVTANIGTTGGLALDATLAALSASLIARLGLLGQATMAGSAPVVIASDQSAIPVSGVVTADISPTNTVNTNDETIHDQLLVMTDLLERILEAL